MERPNHDLQSLGQVSKESRVLGLVITIAVQAGAVIALVVGLAHTEIKKELLALNASVEKKAVVAKAPPPPPPDLIRPPPPTTVVPEFAIEAPPPPAAPKPVAAPAPPVKVAPTELKPIERTHTIPPYPTISQRLGEQGTTLLKVTISTAGVVTDAAVEKSSGSERLDAAAIEYVKSHWRWQPPTREGQPVVATTLVSVKWDLKDAQ